MYIERSFTIVSGSHWKVGRLEPFRSAFRNIRLRPFWKCLVGSNRTEDTESFGSCLESSLHGLANLMKIWEVTFREFSR